MMKYRLSLVIFVSLATFISCVQHAVAGSILGVNSATTNMGQKFLLVHSFDQSGLSAGYVSGTTDFDTYIGSNPTHSSKPGTDWGSNQVAGLVDFNLGSANLIDSTAVWNFGGNLPFAITSLQIITALDVAFTSGVVDHGIKNLGVFSNPNPAQVFLSGPVLAQYVRFTNFTSNGATAIALGEVAFRQTDPIPEPTTIALLGIGLTGLAGGAARRRRKKKACDKS